MPQGSWPTCLHINRALEFQLYHRHFAVVVFIGIVVDVVVVVVVDVVVDVDVVVVVVVVSNVVVVVV